MNPYPEIPDKQATLTLLSFEPEEYRYLMDEFEMSDAEKDEFLRVLWNILTTFVDIGFGVDSVQLIGERPPSKDAIDFSGQDSTDALTRFNKLASGAKKKEITS